MCLDVKQHGKKWVGFFARVDQEDNEPIKSNVKTDKALLPLILTEGVVQVGLS